MGGCRSLMEARGGSGWLSTGPAKDFSEACWWELTVLPMLAYLLWAVLYYIKVQVLPLYPRSLHKTLNCARSRILPLYPRLPTQAPELCGLPSKYAPLLSF